MAMTSKDLIASKSKILARKKDYLYVDIDGIGVWKFENPTPQDYIDNDVYFEAHKKEVRNTDVLMIFNRCVEPNLRDPELAKAFAEETGHDPKVGPWIVDAILQTGQVSRIATIFLEANGFLNNSAVMLSDDDLKKAKQEFIAYSEYEESTDLKNA